MKWAFWLIGAAGLGIVAYGTYMRWIDPTKVISADRIEIVDTKNGSRGWFTTRKLKGGGITTEQVELPGGTWIDCASDCRDAVRKATVDFWDEQRKKK